MFETGNPTGHKLLHQHTDEIKERAFPELSDCSELVLKALIPVIRSVKEALRTKDDEEAK